MTSNLPPGTVTFLFTDIEGSTQLWEQYPEAMQAALARHDAILRQFIEANRGYVVKTTGDGCHAVFETAIRGVVAALAAQQALCTEQWDEIKPRAVRVRMALHTGEAEVRAGDYYGPSPNRAARLMSIGHGGQILLSATTADLARDHLPAGATLLDLGEHRLKDLIRPERVFQLVHPALPADFPPLTSLDVFPNNLPVQLTSFVGRAREMAEAKQLLSTARLLTLIGPGGTGKTRLAVQMAAEVLPAFADGVWLAELAPLADPALVLQTIASVFELREIPGLPLIGLVTNYLRAKHLLLILDNCEHLIEACARLADHLLHACPHLKIIASSREALGIAGETVYRVPSLSLPDTPHLTPDILTQCEAVQLLVERAVAAQPHFALTERNAPAVAQICQRLDGIPLAIELAAARVKVFTPEQIATHLDDRFRLLTGGSRTALPRHQTLRALIDWSWDLLSEPERALLRRLSVFAGGWTFEAAEAVCGDLDVLNLLTQLVNKSLVMVDGHADAGEARYHFLETIRQYARDKLFESGEAAAARDRHLDHFVRLAEEAEPKLRGPEALSWLDQLDLEYDNVRAALEWGLEHHPEAALRLAGSLHVFWDTRASVTEARHWLQEALTRVDALPPVEGEAATRRARARAKGLIAAGMLAFARGDNTAAHPALSEGIVVARACGDKLTLGYALSLRAAAMLLNDVPGARTAAEESLALARESGDARGLSFALQMLAWVEGRQGNDAARRALLDEARMLVGGSNDLWTYFALLSIGLEARWRGDLTSARLHLQECAKFFRQAKIKHFEAAAQSELAHIARQSGDYQAAKDAYRQTMLMWKDLGHRAAIAHQLECFAFIARTQNQPQRASRLLGAAEALREAIGTPMTDYERAEYEREVAALHAQMDEEAYASAWARGRAMKMEQAIAYALEQMNV